MGKILSIGKISWLQAKSNCFGAIGSIGFGGQSIGAAWHHNTHRDDVLERVVHTHVQLHHIGSGHHEKETRGGIGCSGDIHAHAVVG